MLKPATQVRMPHPQLDLLIGKTVALSLGLNWSTIELAIAIACACLPCYGPFIPTEKAATRLEKWYRSSQKWGSSRQKGNHGSGYSRFEATTEDIQDVTAHQSTTDTKENIALGDIRV